MAKPSHCPACGEAQLLKQTPLIRDVRLYSCESCGGLLACPDAVVAAREYYHRSHPVMVQRPSIHRCRKCNTIAGRDRTCCADCGSSLLLSCPTCSKTMALVSLVGITVDACYGCTLAYFDRGEFIYVCNNPVVFITALTPGAASSSSVWDYVNSGADAAETVHLAAHGASAAGEAALQGAEQVSKALVNTDVVTAAGTAGKASVQAAEVLADAGEVAAEAVLEVLAGVFGGF